MQTLLTNEKAIFQNKPVLKPVYTVQISADDLKSPKIKLRCEKMNQQILVLLSELYQFYSSKKKMILIIYLMFFSFKHTPDKCCHICQKSIIYNSLYHAAHMFKPLLLHIQTLMKVQGPPTQIDAFQINIFSRLYYIMKKKKIFLKS